MKFASRCTIDARNNITFPNWLRVIRICREREREKPCASCSPIGAGVGVRGTENNGILPVYFCVCRAGGNTVAAQPSRKVCWIAARTDQGRVPGFRVLPFEPAGRSIECIEETFDAADKGRAVYNDGRCLEPALDYKRRPFRRKLCYDMKTTDPGRIGKIACSGLGAGALAIIPIGVPVVLCSVRRADNKREAQTQGAD